MADYFAALAARTLRPELSVQPRQRVRWEEGLEPMAVSAPAPQKQVDDAERSIALDDRESHRRLRRSPAIERTEPEDEQVRPQPRRQAREAVRDHDDTTAATVPTPHPTVRAVEPTVQVRVERVVTLTSDAPGKSSVAARDRVETPARIGGSGSMRPLSTRLSKAERAAEPAIRIHIGRIDVRAVTPAAPGPSPSATRDRKRELMSIDEYVHKRDRGAS